MLLVTGVLSVVGYVLEIKDLEVYTKPMTVPLLFMLYWFNTKKLNWIFVLVLILSFVGDVLLLIGLPQIIYILDCYLFCYSLLFYFLFKDYKSLQYTKKDIFSIVVIFSLFTLLIYQIYWVIVPNVEYPVAHTNLYFLVLYSLFISSWLQYVNIKSAKALWFVIAITSFIISDVCFAIDHFYIEVLGLKIINGVYQLLAVFFLVQYKLASPKAFRAKNAYVKSA